LTSITFYDNEIYDEGFSAIAKALRQISLHSLLKHVHKPLEKRFIPLVAHAVKRRCVSRKKLEVSLLLVNCSWTDFSFGEGSRHT
jgi:hypothetical protein